MAHVVSVDHMQILAVDGVSTGVHLTQTEEAMLRAILSHSHTATREYLLSFLYKGADEPDLKIIDVFACKLRKKLGVHKDAIITVWGRGFARHADYTIVPKEEQFVAVGCNAKTLEETVFAAGETAQELVNRLLQAEHDRLWSSEAA